MQTVKHGGLEELHDGDIGVLLLKLNHLLDLGHLEANKGALGVTLAVDEGQDSVSLFPAVVAGEPSRRLGQEEKTKEEDDGGDHLKSPWNTESLWTQQEAAAITNVVHDLVELALLNHDWIHHGLANLPEYPK